MGVLWRAEWDPVVPAGLSVERCRLRGLFAAFAVFGVAAEPVVYSDDRAAVVRKQLLGLDGVLVWVNPIEKGHDRSALDLLLREVAEVGTFVSAHPDVIAKIATKQVLWDTARMSWSADTYLYASHGQLVAELPARLSARGSLVLKQHRGMGGAGVWKVELENPDERARGRSAVRLQHAEKGSRSERSTLAEFIQRCRGYFDPDGLMVEQPFQPRLAEGMIRVYLSHDQVVGFAHQHPAGLLPPDVAAGLPKAKVFLPTTEPGYQRLRERVESEWVPELQQIAGVATPDLPVIWDIDFLFGPKDTDGQDSYVLCEINASSTFAFPEAAMPTVARQALEHISRNRSAQPSV